MPPRMKPSAVVSGRASRFVVVLIVALVAAAEGTLGMNEVGVVWGKKVVFAAAPDLYLVEPGRRS